MSVSSATSRRCHTTGMSSTPTKTSNPVTSRMLRIVAVATAALVLAGCGRFHVDLDVTEDNTLNGEIIIAMIVGDGDNAEAQAEATADDLESQLLPGLREASGVTHEEYAEDGYLGSRLILLGTPLSALESSEAFTLVRDGDVFQFEGKLALAPNDDETGSDETGSEDDVVPDDGESDVVISL